jgi:hypothetical protein
VPPYTGPEVVGDDVGDVVVDVVGDVVVVVVVSSSPQPLRTRIVTRHVTKTKVNIFFKIPFPSLL